MLRFDLMPLNEAGFILAETRSMPANNLMLLFHPERSNR
jgi:hypothetical protein